MTSNQSPFLLAKQLESDVTRLLTGIDLTELPVVEQQAIRRLKRSLVDARLEVQDYELAETREHQLKNAVQARRFLKSIQSIISSNTIDVFGAVDVAHITAHIEQVTDKLE